MLETEYEYYQNNKDELLKQYNGKIIVIIGNNVIGDYNKKNEAIIATKKKHKLGTFLVQKVSTEENDQIQRFYSRVYV